MLAGSPKKSEKSGKAKTISFGSLITKAFNPNLPA